MVCGKPGSAFFRAGVSALGMPVENVIMVGDDIVSDVGGAQAAGIRGVQVSIDQSENRIYSLDQSESCILETDQLELNI